MIFVPSKLIKPLFLEAVTNLSQLKTIYIIANVGPTNKNTNFDKKDHFTSDLSLHKTVSPWLNQSIDKSHHQLQNSHRIG